MKFLSYGTLGRERAGFLLDGGIVDLESCLRDAGAADPVSDLRRFLERSDWEELLGQLTRAARSGKRAAVDPKAVRIGAPIPRPGQVVLAGVNFRSHQKEATAAAVPSRPVILGKVAAATCGPFDDIECPPEIRKLDYEGEVAVVIGRMARRVPPERIYGYVAGFTIMNDVSGRDLQLADHETNPFFRVHFLGKSADTFAPTGPYLVTRDEFDLSQHFRIRTWVGEELRQDGSTRDLIFSIADLISYVSQFVTLHPGDVIATGTPGGVGHFMNPPVYLRHGQVVKIEVDGIGMIENRVRDELVA